MKRRCRFYSSSFADALLRFDYLVKDEQFAVTTTEINYECCITWRHAPLQLRLVFAMPDIPRLWMTCLIDNKPREEQLVVKSFPSHLCPQTQSYFQTIESMPETAIERAFLNDDFGELHRALVVYYAEITYRRLKELQAMASKMAARVS